MQSSDGTPVPVVVLGGGFTGLAAGISTGGRVLEALPCAGGICRSYYVRPGESEPRVRRPADGDAYRFEVGGGHWIFGGNRAVISFLEQFGPLQSRYRRSAVHFMERDLTVPFPLQDHLDLLGGRVARRARSEMAAAQARSGRTMADWLTLRFGPTLGEIFFGPFHDRYTAGLYTEIGPQDGEKSPAPTSRPRARPAGYNACFVYPTDGFDALADRMAARCDIRLGVRVVAVDLESQVVCLEDGREEPYGRLFSTLPLRHTLDMAGIVVPGRPDPYTSVLVLNIGATAGRACPTEHWLYIPDSRAGFHRVGIYSNVDDAFLPSTGRASGRRVSLYVERAYREGERPPEEAVSTYKLAVAAELRELGWIDDVESLHATWIEVAYTWCWPGSRWRDQALEALARRDLRQTGRYGRWRFQGIAASISEGLAAGAV